MSISQRLYMQTNSWFFEKNRNIKDDYCQKISLPKGWSIINGDYWTNYRSKNHVIDNQGWKIHISATPSTLSTCIDVASRLCFQLGIPFKHIRSFRIYDIQNDKAAPRSGSGKCVTIYPRANEFDILIDRLEAELGGLPGPYILSDIRWKSGPLYIRFGGFKKIKRINLIDNSTEYCITNPDGELELDERTVHPVIPGWVHKLSSIEKNISESDEVDAVLPWNVERAKHISNSGGVYLAHPIHGDKSSLPPDFIIKEARPFTAYDEKGQDAVIRLHHEYSVMNELANTRICPEPYAFTHVWEHSYIIMENIEGDTLKHISVFKNPLLSSKSEKKDIKKYSEFLLDIFDQLLTTLDIVHDKGYLFGDLTPDNIVVQSNGKVRLIDWETTTRITEANSKLGKPGFVAPRYIGGPQRDVWAAAASILNCIEPYAEILEINPQKVDGWLMDLLRNDQWHALAKKLRVNLHLKNQTSTSIDFFMSSTNDSRRERMIAGILAAKKDQGYFPGDVQQFQGQGIYSLEYGATGVAAALYYKDKELAKEVITEASAGSLQSLNKKQSIQDWSIFPQLGGLYLWEMKVGITSPQKILDYLGKVIESSSITEVNSLGWNLEYGASGVALIVIEANLQLGRHKSELAEHLLNDCVSKVLVASKTGKCPVGLLNGPTGVSYVCYRMWILTGTKSWLDKAEELLNIDLEQLDDSNNGLLMPLNKGSKKLLIPYLGSGSVGVGLVAGLLNRFKGKGKYLNVMEKIAETALTPTIVYSGLFNGRAGLALYVGTMAAQNGFIEKSFYKQMLKKCQMHEVSYGHGLLHVGDGLSRLSTDLATGTAGILLAGELSDADVADPIGSILGLSESEEIRTFR